VFERKPALDRTEVWVRWHHAMGVPITVASSGAAADRLVAEGSAWRDGDALRPLLSPQLRRHSPLALDEHFRAVRAILWSLERGGKYQVAKIAAAATLSESVTEAALAVLAEAGLITLRGGQVAPAVTPPKRTAPVEWSALVSRPVPTAAPPPPMQPPPPPAAAPKPPLPAPKPPPASAPAPKPPPTPAPRPAPVAPGLMPGWPVAATPEPEPEPVPPAAVAPEPEPEPVPPAATPEPKPKTAAVPARVTTRTLAATIVPTETATVDGDGDEESQLLRRLVFAAEVSAGLVSGPTRVRTPLGVNHVLDTQLRCAVVLCGAGRPMMASEISAYHLTPEQKVFLAAALEDGCKRGGFTSTGGRGRSGRGRLYSLADVTVFDGVSWEALHAAVAAQREARERRKLGSGASATR